MRASQWGIILLGLSSLQMETTQATSALPSSSRVARGQRQRRRRQLQEDRKGKSSSRDEDPTPFPTSPPPTFKPLTWSIEFPLGRCEGDCDNDGDCQSGFECFQRNGGEPVPGCSGIDDSSIDYCIVSTAPPQAAPAIPASTVPPTPAPTDAPTVAPVSFAASNPPNSQVPSSAPVWDACEKAQDGDVFTTPFGMSVIYYYEVLTTRTAQLLNVTREVDARFQEFLATSLVDCALAEQSNIQGISPAGVDNLAGECESSLADDANDELVCYQMQGSVEVYLAEFYYFSLSAATSNDVRDLVWDTLRAEVNPSRRKLTLEDESLGIYGLFFISGTDLTGVDTAQEAADNSSGGAPEESGIGTYAAIGIVFACFVLGIVLFAVGRKYRTYTKEQEDYKLEHSSVFTDSEVNDDSLGKVREATPPPMSLFRNSPHMMESSPMPSLPRESPPMESPPPSPAIPPTKVHYKPRHGDAPSQASGSAFEVMFQDEPFPGPANLVAPASLDEDDDEDLWSLPDLGGDLLADSGTMKPPSPPTIAKARTPSTPMSNVGVATELTEDQFRVTGYSQLSSLSTLAEQYERPAMITPIIKPEVAPTSRGRSGHSSYQDPHALLGSYNYTRSNSVTKKSNPFAPIDPNQSQAHAIYGQDHSKPNPPPVTSTGGIPRTQTTFSSMTTKLSNRRSPSNLNSSERIPSYKEEFQPIPDSNSEDHIQYESRLDLARLAHPTRIPTPGTPSHQSSHSSTLSHGSFNFETLSTARTAVQSSRSQRTPQSEFQFVERGSPQNLYSMPDPISMAFANNAMHSAFKPKKLAYASGAHQKPSPRVDRRRRDALDDSVAL